jgi:hypothetical protein
MAPQNGQTIGIMTTPTSTTTTSSGRPTLAMAETV